jgi:hypothetical protein
VLSKGEHDEIDVSKLDPRCEPNSEGIGALLQVIADAIMGGVMPRRDHFFDERTDLTTDDVIRLGVELETGRAAVLVLGDQSQTAPVIVRLTELGGKAEMHLITRRALQLASSRVRPSEPGEARS